MRFILDTDTFSNEDIGISGCLYLLSMYFKEPITSKTFDKVNEKGYTFIDSFFNDEPIDISITPNGMDLAEKLLTESSVIETTTDGEDRYKRLATKMRELFPTGKKPGTNLQWRDSVPIIATRLKTLVKKYEVSFTDEQVIEATNNYIKSFNGDYRFMQVLRYFIFKNTNSGAGVEQNSQLLSFIENLGQEDESADWTSTLK